MVDEIKSWIKDNGLIVACIAVFIIAFILFSVLYWYGEQTVSTKQSKSNIKLLFQEFTREKSAYEQLQKSFLMHLAAARVANKQAEGISYIIVKEKENLNAEVAHANALSDDSAVVLFTRLSEDYIRTSKVY